MRNEFMIFLQVFRVEADAPSPMKNSQYHPNARSLVEVASRVNNLNAILHPPNRRFGPKFTRTWQAFDINKRKGAAKPDTWQQRFT
jgi:hypothetical protein